MFLEASFELITLLPIVLLLFGGVAITIILHALKLTFLPSFVIFIFVGMIVGIFLKKEVTQFLSSPLGSGLYVVSLVFVLFLSGMETDFNVIKKNSKHDGVNIHPLVRAVIFLGINILLSIVSSIILVKFIIPKGFINQDHELLATILLTIFLSSTFASLVNPVIITHGDSETTIGKIMATYSTISELLSIISLSIVMVIHNIDKGGSLSQTLISLAILIVVLIAVYFFIRLIPGDKLHEKKGEVSTMLFTLAFIIVLAVSIISDYMHFEAIFGAFIAGMVFKIAKVSHQTEHKLNDLGMSIFSPIFYLLVGLNCNISILFTHPNYLLIILVLFIFMIITKSAFISLYKYYYTSTVIPSLLLATATIIVPIAFSHFGVFSDDFISIIIIASSLTCIIPPIIFKTNRHYNEVKEAYRDVILELGETPPNQI